jgi:hypothetical protein
VNSILYSRQALHFTNRQRHHSAKKYFSLGEMFSQLLCMECFIFYLIG